MANINCLFIIFDAFFGYGQKHCMCKENCKKGSGNESKEYLSLLIIL